MDRKDPARIENLLSRRDFLKRGGTAAVGLTVGGGLLAACAEAVSTTTLGGTSTTLAGTSTTAGPTTTIGGASTTVPSGGLAPWDPNVPAGTVPDLPGVIAKGLPNSAAEFWQRVEFGMNQAASDVGLEFLVANSEGDVTRNVEQMEGFLNRGIGSLAITVIDPVAQAPVAQRAIDAGIFVIGNVFVPAHCHDDGDQYTIGRRLGESAANYLNNELGGEAKVLHFNFDHVESVIPRHDGVLDGLAAAPGAQVVQDLTLGAENVTQEAAFQATSTAFQQDPEISVILGIDTWCLGALAALEAEGRADPRMFIGGVDGETQAIEAIRLEGPYKVSFAWPMEVLAYGWTQFAADWLQGKSVPKFIDLGVVELSAGPALAGFEESAADPGSFWRDYPELGFLGNISYDTRDEYLTELYSISG